MAEIDTTRPCDVHAQQLKTLEQSDTDQWEHINSTEDALRKLGPIWITVALMVMSGVIGSALTFAGMIIKFAGSTQ